MSLYYGGRILTMVGETKETVKYVEAVIEKDGKIAFAGNLAEAKKKFRGKNVVNLEGRTMMPGHIDPHLHPSMASLILKMDFITPFEWVLPSGTYPGVRTEEGYRTRLKKLISQRNYISSRKDFLITWGYHQSFHGKMSKGVIDDLKPLGPVVVWHRSFHEVYLGTIALEQLKYDDLDELKKNPQVEWDEGHFYEMGLDALLNTSSFKDHVFPLMEEGYKDLVQVVNYNGITTVADLEFPALDLEIEKGMVAKNLKSKDAFFSSYCVCSSRNFGRMAEDHEKALVLIQDLAKEFSDDQLIVYSDHVKGLFDGAFYSQLMQMADGYPDGHPGEWITEPRDLAEMMEVYWKSKPKGFQIHVHTNGDLGMAKLLEIVEHLQTKYPRNHRTTVEHAGYFTKDQADKIAELGLMVSAAPYYLHTLAEKYSSETDGIGKARAEAMTPLRWLFDKGVVTTVHSDFTMAPSNPLLLAWCAVNRVSAEGNQFREDLTITPYEGMLAITKNAAIILGTDDIMGTIEEGKLANFTILEKDPLEVEPIEIRNIKIYAAVYKGKMNKINA